MCTGFRYKMLSERYKFKEIIFRIYYIFDKRVPKEKLKRAKKTRVNQCNIIPKMKNILEIKNFHRVSTPIRIIIIFIFLII